MPDPTEMPDRDESNRVDRGSPDAPPSDKSREELADELERTRDERDRYRAQFEQVFNQLSEIQEQLGASRDRYAGLYHSAPVGFVTLDPTGLIGDSNFIGAQMLGIRRNWLLGRPLMGCVAKGGRWALLDHMRRCREAHRDLVISELWLAPRGGEPIYAQLISRPVREAGGRVFRTAIIDQTARHRAEQAVREREAELQKLNEALRQQTREAERRAEQLRAMAMELTQAEQRERRRLAQILHDHLQQILVATKMQAEDLVNEEYVEGEHSVKEIGGQMMNLLDEAIDSARNLSRELCPPVLYDQGLAAALEWLGRRFRDQHALAVEVRADPEADPGGHDLQAFHFQSVRELLLNAVKHGRATRAWVETACHEGVLTISVEDNGAGGEPDQMLQQADSGGFGLFSIRERLNMLDGSMSVRTAPGAGCCVTLCCAANASPEGDGRSQPGGVSTGDEQSGEPTQAGDVGEGEERPIRVMLVDDHRFVREGLGRILCRTRGIELVAEAADGREAVERVEACEPELILMDASMPRMDGAEATRVILRSHPQIRIIGMSIHDREDLAKAMYDAGALDYLPKGTPSRELIEVIRRYAGRYETS